LSAVERAKRKRVKLKIGRLAAKWRGQLESYLKSVLDVEPSKYLPRDLYVTCFDKYCLVHEGAGREEKVTLLYAGMWIGVIVMGKIYPSTALYEKIYAEHGYRAALLVGDRGVKNFLYSRDILEESVIEKYPPLNNPLAVLDYSDRRVLGVVEPSGQGVYKHVYDLSMFLHILG